MGPGGSGMGASESGMDTSGDGGDERGRFRQRVGLVLGAMVFVAVLVVPAPGGMSQAGWRAAGVGGLMAVWWVAEVMPIAATALLPLVLFPVLGVTGIEEAAAPYANPLIFLFLGGFLIALGMERWGLPRRIALVVVSAVGTRPEAVVAGFMVSAAFLSMWVSNTATAMMMLPIGLSVITLVRRDTGEAAPGEAAAGEAAAGEMAAGETSATEAAAGEASAGKEPPATASGPEAAPDGRSDPEEDQGARPRPPVGNFGTCLMLGIAYACSVGGVATLIGTPPNAFLAGFFSETYGVEITFVRWMALGLPLTVVGLPVAWWVLTRWAFPIPFDRLPGGRELLRRQRRELGPLSSAERRVAVVFGLVAAAWIARPLLEAVVPGLTDAGIALAGGVGLFLLPSGADEGGALLRWEDAARLPWGVLVLFGGGLSLAAALQTTGVAGWLGRATSGLAGTPMLVMVAVTAAMVVLLTELTSNTATTAAFLPVLASVAVGAGQDPRMLAVPAAVAASCAFMLPVATPPNAIVYGSGEITVPQMARAGAAMNVVFVLLLAAAARLLLPLVFGVEPGLVPAWATGG